MVELRVSPGDLRRPVDHAVEPWRVDPGFEPWLDRLHFLVWANNYDARGGEPVWWWGRKAAEVGATVAGPADVTLPDGVTGLGRRRSPHHPPSRRVRPWSTPRPSTAGRLDPIPAPVAPTAALDPEQLAAVAHDAGPARVIAPAGSGKTRVLTERLRHLIADRGYETGTVLALAYNKQAQLEMASRTAGLGARTQTLNAWGYELVGRILGRRPEVLDERAVRAIVEGLVPRPVRRVNTDPYARYLEGLSLIRLGLRPPHQVEDDFGDVPGLADAFAPYRAMLRARGVVDFDEQVYLAIEAAPRRRRVAPFAPGRAPAPAGRRVPGPDPGPCPAHPHSCPAQHSTSSRWATTTRPSTATPEPTPVSSSTSTASSRRRLHHALEVNYRCPAPVTDAARHLLGYNTVRVDKVIRAGPAVATASPGLEVRSHPPDRGAATLTEVVTGWLGQGAASDEIAVLSRVQSLLLGPHVALSDAGIPVDSIVDRSVLGRLGVRAALAYLRIATDPGNVDPADLVEVQRRPSRGLPQWIDRWLATVPFGRRRRPRQPTVSKTSRCLAKVRGLADDLAALAERAAAAGTTRDLLTAVRDDIGLGTAMSLLDSTGVAAASHLDDLEGLLQLADLHPEPAGFGPWLLRALSTEPTDGGVTLSTVHRVKGREWPMVAVFGVNGGILPHRLSDLLEEERRILHVAITRSSTPDRADRRRLAPFTVPRRAGRDRAPSPSGRPTLRAISGGDIHAGDRRRRRRRRPGPGGIEGVAGRPRQGRRGPGLCRDVGPAHGRHRRPAARRPRRAGRLSRDRAGASHHVRGRHPRRDPQHRRRLTRPVGRRPGHSSRRRRAAGIVRSVLD